MAFGSKLYLAILLLATLSCILVLQISLDGWIQHGKVSLRRISFIDHKEVPSMKILPSASLQQVNISKYSEFNSTVSNSLTPKELFLLHNGVAELRHNISFSLTANFSTPSHTVSTTPQMKMQVKQLKVEKLRHPTKSIRSQILLDRQKKYQENLKRKEMAKLLPKAIKAIQGMPTPKPENVIRIFLITYFRSGSSFVGELLQQNWKTFYQFEPLHYMTYGERISDTRTREAFDLFRGIFHCNFTNLNNYFTWVKKKKNQFLFSRSLFLWFSCRANPAMCFDPRFVSVVCSRATAQIVKVTRLHMSQLKVFLQENTGLNIKVVYLSRDPRGIVSSRWSLDWCNETDCSDPGVLCKEMEDDISLFTALQTAEPSKFIQVRYEDMALDPMSEAVKLFKFLNLPFSSSVQRYIKSHSVARKADNLNPYSTRRNSSTMAFSWRHRFTFEKLSTVQSACSKVIQSLNFTLINTPEELANLSNTLGYNYRNSNLTLNSSYNNHNIPMKSFDSEKHFPSEQIKNSLINRRFFEKEHLSSANYKNASNYILYQHNKRDRYETRMHG